MAPGPCRAVILHLCRCFKAAKPQSVSALLSGSCTPENKYLKWERFDLESSKGVWGPPRLFQKPSQVSNEFQWPQWDVLGSLTPRVCVQWAGGVFCVSVHGHAWGEPPKNLCVCPWELGQQPDTVFLVCVPPACQGGVWEGQGWQRAGVLFWWLVSPSPSSPHCIQLGFPQCSPLSAQMLVFLSLYLWVLFCFKMKTFCTHSRSLIKLYHRGNWRIIEGYVQQTRASRTLPFPLKQWSLSRVRNLCGLLGPW